MSIWSGKLTSVAEPEHPVTADFRAAPELEPIFYQEAFLRRLHLLGKQKIKTLFLCINHEFRTIYEDNKLLERKLNVVGISRYYTK